jgi:hypothetical protein
MTVQTTMPLGPDESLVASHHHPTSPPDRLLARNIPTPGIHSRESSTTRGRLSEAPATALGISNLQPQLSQPPTTQRPGQSHSKSPEASSNISRSGSGYEGTLERKLSTSASYGHHRKTSIVHGIQHSRNPSFATPTTTSSPLSPELIAAAGFGGNGTAFDFSMSAELHTSSSFSTLAAAATAHTQTIPLSTIKDDDSGETPPAHPSNPVHRKMSSNGKPRREGSHSRSHSKHHTSESKTVGEYALHHLFNSVRDIFYSLE